MSERWRAVTLAALLGGVSCASCTPVRAWERGKLAHYTMAPDGVTGPAADHVYAVHEGASGGSAVAGSGCGCN
jgi:hypothetical protein